MASMSCFVEVFRAEETFNSDKLAEALRPLVVLD
jgi:hypothetical protein